METQSRAVLVDGVWRMDMKTDGLEEPNASIYEVVRILEGRPVFLKEHLERMEGSFEILGWPVPEAMEALGRNVGAYIARSNLLNGNLKLVMDRLDTSRPRSLIYEIPSRYPEAALYETGVDTITRVLERKDPGAKRSNPALREAVDRIRAREGIYEVLLVDRHGHVTEGSRSNVFFVQGERLATPPDKGVLPGITRMKVLDFCRMRGIGVESVDIKAESLEAFEGAFLSGTSIHLLPVRSINGRQLAVTPFMKALSRAFDAFVRSETEGQRDRSFRL